MVAENYEIIRCKQSSRDGGDHVQHVESFSSLQSLMFQSTLFLLRIEARQPQHRSGMFFRVGEVIGLIFTPVRGSI